MIRGRIELRDLRYSYPGARDTVLRGIDLDIEHGETLAVLGRVGAGKTTLLRCFVRLLDPPPGTLLIDGYDVRDFKLSQLRHQVVLVPQDPFLFATLLRHNLSYDNPERDDALIWSAAGDADLRDTIVAFANALDTPVGERGVTLSGGQKQRSTLTRGLIRTPPVLILDDCFSSVDTETEEHILRRLRSVRRGMTTILVSHRVSTARHADRIIVLADGVIAEMGTHDELIERGGWYAELERTQRRRGRLLTQLHEAEVAMSGPGVQEHAVARDYGVFDAELAGRSFNAHLIGRLFDWVRPHWRQALLSGVLVLDRVGARDHDAGDRRAGRHRWSVADAAIDRVAGLRHERRHRLDRARTAACRTSRPVARCMC